jgi:hypothetical protein
VEYSKLWKSKEIDGIELLKASFQSFEFCKHWHDELAIGIIKKVLRACIIVATA